MKSTRFSKILAKSRSCRLVGLALAAPALVLGTTARGSTIATTPPAKEAAKETVEPGTNWIDFTVGGALVSGSNAGFLSRTQSDNFYGGIGSFSFEDKFNETTTLKLDGHALPGLEDYEFNINVIKDDLGYAKAGYRQFRTWYNNLGGYLTGQPLNLLSDSESSVNRGELYFEAGLRKDNAPEMTFSYKHGFRDGQKDSLVWGDNLIIPPVQPLPPLPPIPPQLDAKLLPAWWGIDEQSDTFEFDFDHTIGNTDFGFGLLYENTKIKNTRTTQSDTNGITLTEATNMDLFAANVHSVTRFNDRLWLTLGYAYNNVETETDGGSRRYDPYLMASGNPSAYDTMLGGSNLDQVIGNINVRWNPVADLTIVPSLRLEHEQIDSLASFSTYRPVMADPLTGIMPLIERKLQMYESQTETNSTIGALDIRYTGIPNTVLYAKGQMGSEEESVYRRDSYLPGEWLNSDIQYDEQEFTLGANWYALPGLSFSLQGFHQERDQSMDHTAGDQGVDPLFPLQGGANNLRPIMVEHDSEINDINFRVKWRPLPKISMVTRFDFGNTNYKNQGIHWKPTNPAPAVPVDPAAPVPATPVKLKPLMPASGDIWPVIESGDITTQILSQSVTWNPMERLYFTGSVHFVWSQTDTPSVDVPDADNNYFTGNLAVGYAIDDKTDITASYNYYGTSNYSAALGAMGYGMETEEHDVGVTLTRLLSPNMIWTLRYGFITSNTHSIDETGSFNDFDANMLSTSLQIRF